MRFTACKPLGWIFPPESVADMPPSRWDLNCSTLYPGNLRYRKMSVICKATLSVRLMTDHVTRCVEVMRNLVAKYPGGYEAWAKGRGEQPVVK